MTILENVPLAPLTTLKVGGPARYFAEPNPPLRWRRQSILRAPEDLPLFVLGGGSNLVVADAGWPGLVLKLAIRGIDERDSNDSGKTLFEVGAGEEWDRFVARAVAQKLRRSRMSERHSRQRRRNSRCKMWERTARKSPRPSTSVLVFDLQRRAGSRALLRSLRISISHQHFQHQRTGTLHHPARDLCLTPGGKPRIEYADLKKHFAGFQQAPSLTSTREAVRRIRAAKAMLITPGDEDCRSAGSFFKNPVLSADQFEELDAACDRQGIADSQLSRARCPEKGFSRMAGGALRLQQGVQERAGRDLAQARAGHRKPRRSHRRRHSGIERSHSAARGRTLGHSTRARAGVSSASEVVSYSCALANRVHGQAAAMLRASFALLQKCWQTSHESVCRFGYFGLRDGTKPARSCRPASCSWLRA